MGWRWPCSVVFLRGAGGGRAPCRARSGRGVAELLVGARAGDVAGFGAAGDRDGPTRCCTRRPTGQEVSPSTSDRRRASASSVATPGTKVARHCSTSLPSCQMAAHVGSRQRVAAHGLQCSAPARWRRSSELAPRGVEKNSSFTSTVVPWRARGAQLAAARVQQKALACVGGREWFSDTELMAASASPENPWWPRFPGRADW